MELTLIVVGPLMGIIGFIVSGGPAMLVSAIGLGLIIGLAIGVIHRNRHTMKMKRA